MLALGVLTAKRGGSARPLPWEGPLEADGSAGIGPGFGGPTPPLRLAAANDTAAHVSPFHTHIHTTNTHPRGRGVWERTGFTRRLFMKGGGVLGGTRTRTGGVGVRLG